MAENKAHEPVRPWLYGVPAALSLLVVVLLVVFAPSGLKLMTFITFLLAGVLFFRSRSSDYLWLYRFAGINMFVFQGGLMLELPGMSIDRLPKARRQRQFPEEPENVYHGDDKDTLPPRPDGRGFKVRPFRVVTGGPREDYKSHLNVQMTTKATGTVKYHIDPDHAFDFHVRIPGRNAEAKFAELERQMLDTWGKTILREYELRPVGLIIDQGEAIRHRLREDLSKELLGTGVVLDEVNLESPDLSHDVSVELARIASANAGGQARRIEADASAYATEVDGSAKAKARLATLQAEADGVAYQADKMGIDGQQVFAAQTAERIIGKNDKVLFGAGAIAEATASGKIIVDALKGASQGGN